MPTALSASEAAIVKGLLARGDHQHKIAAFFAVNAGRVAEVATGDKHRDVVPVSRDKLPPAAALDGSFALYEALGALRTARAALDEAEARIKQWLPHERRQSNRQAGGLRNPQQGLAGGLRGDLDGDRQSA